MKFEKFFTLYNECTKEVEEMADNEFRYMFLDRLVQDIKYYLNYGNRNNKYLYYHDIDKQVVMICRLLHFFQDNEIMPNWFSFVDLTELELKIDNKDILEFNLKSEV